MSIHPDVLTPRQAEAGKIKIGGLGEKRTKRSGDGEYQLPVRHDYFTVTTTVRDNSGNFTPDHALMHLLPKDKDGKIRELPILLDSDKIDEVFRTQLACYAGRNLHCKGDGKNPATRYEIRNQTRDGKTVRIKTGNSKTVPCTCPYLTAPEEGGLQCKPHGTLWCTIVASEQTRLGARHAFRTTSWNSIRAIQSALETIQSIVGTLVGIPLWLCVRPQLARPTGSDRSTTIQVVHIECRTQDLLGLQQHAIAQAKGRHLVAQLAGRPIRLGLAAPGDSENPAEEAATQQEYHPDFELDDDGTLYDASTGEVLDGPTLDDDLVDPPAPEPENQDPPEFDGNAILPDDHPLRRDMAQLLTDVALDRDFSGDDMKKGRMEIWVEACEKAEYPGLGFKDLTTARARKIELVLLSFLRDPEQA